MKINRLPIRTKSWRSIIYRSGNNTGRKKLRTAGGSNSLRTAGGRNPFRSTGLGINIKN